MKMNQFNFFFKENQFNSWNCSKEFMRSEIFNFKVFFLKQFQSYFKISINKLIALPFQDSSYNFKSLSNETYEDFADEWTKAKSPQNTLLVSNKISAMRTSDSFIYRPKTLTTIG